jgi:hypothetical protein
VFHKSIVTRVFVFVIVFAAPSSLTGSNVFGSSIAAYDTGVPSTRRTNLHRMFTSVIVLMPYELHSSENCYFMDVMSVLVYLIDRTTQHHISEDNNVGSYSYKNLKYLILFYLFIFTSLKLRMN